MPRKNIIRIYTIVLFCINKNMKNVFLPTLLLALTLPSLALAHPGRTDSSGCHTCRTNCASWGLSTGEYHCHRSKGIPQPLAPVRSIKAEHVTIPAPEYAVPSPVTPKASAVISTSTPRIPWQNQIIPSKPIKGEGWMTRFYNFIFK